MRRVLTRVWWCGVCSCLTIEHRSRPKIHNAYLHCTWQPYMVSMIHAEHSFNSVHQSVCRCIALALHCDCWCTAIECVRRTGVYDGKGRPPIQRALRYSHPEIVRLLVGYGSNTAYRDTHGNTLAHLAAAVCYIAVRASSCDTPLHCWLTTMDLHCVEYRQICAKQRSC
jgi:hypothetical protein